MKWPLAPPHGSQCSCLGFCYCPAHLQLIDQVQGWWEGRLYSPPDLRRPMLTLKVVQTRPTSQGCSVAPVTKRGHAPYHCSTDARGVIEATRPVVHLCCDPWVTC
ncbi:hypothetical protein NDU88_002312 [Pleurodeles waltl]|uniref:Uncharacterized protein n=1 Tax=Pleurodeles waltl TaxID=8319 RepID=A0AAV7RBH9_PLEWA|nr:hypothetical protein NDU88_002312 [Pleurodeles waltl]